MRRPCARCSRFATPSGRPAAAARAAARPVDPRTVQTAVRHLRRRAFPLRLSPPVAERTDQPDDFAAIRWIGPTRIRHEVLESLLCHPSSAVHYRVNVPVRFRFRDLMCAVAECMAAPRRRGRLPRAPRDTEDGWTAVRECRLDPARRYTDRRWHQLRIPLPPLAEPAARGDACRWRRTSAPGSDTGHAWALFGEPRFEWKRPQAEVRASVRPFVQRLRNDGMARDLCAALAWPLGRGRGGGYTQWVSTHTRSKPELEAHAAGYRRAADSAAHQHHHARVTTPTPGGSGRASSRSAARSTRTGSCACATTRRARQDRSEVFHEYANDPRVRVVRRADNAGISAASNAARARSRGVSTSRCSITTTS